MPLDRTYHHNVPFDVFPPVGLGVTPAAANHLGMETAGFPDYDYRNPKNVDPQILKQQQAQLQVYQSNKNRKRAPVVNQNDLTMSDRKRAAAHNSTIELLDTDDDDDDVVLLSAGE